MQSLKSEIERIVSAEQPGPGVREIFLEFRDALTRGEIRAAEKIDGDWRVNVWVKQGILLGFWLGELTQMGSGECLSFVDKDTFPARKFSVADRVRMVPGGSSARLGAYIAPSVICMPPTFINVGAYVDEGTMIDSHALAGSCAQIGKRVHLSAAAQIGGVLEPVNACPVIIEDDVLSAGTAESTRVPLSGHAPCLELVSSSRAQLRFTILYVAKFIGRAKKGRLRFRKVRLLFQALAQSIRGRR